MSKLAIAITGPAGSGKTTVAAELAKQLERCVNIEVDQVKHMIVNGFVYDESPAGIVQWELLGENIGILARNFQDAGYQVIVNGYVNEPAWKNIYKHLEFTHKFLLLPNLEIIKQRDKQRPPEWILGDVAVAVHYDYFSNSKFYAEFTKLDTTQEALEQTINTVKGLLGSTTPA